MQTEAAGREMKELLRFQKQRNRFRETTACSGRAVQVSAAVVSINTSFI